jgi:hypothetical protein
MNIPQSKIIFNDKNSELKDFRYPEVNIAGLSEGPTPRQTIIDDSATLGEENSQYVQEIGSPKDLSLDFQVRRKRGTTTFIDALILFETADGATSHEFRISKIAVGSSSDGEEGSISGDELGGSVTTSGLFGFGGGA